jgi:demethylmenaquinone methyltransferase/2-methoxy-6-polyprenyl-1,4-benzoquinol methylase
VHPAREDDERHDPHPVNGTLNDAFASPEAKARYVRRLFSTIADRYDLITVLLSFGRDRRWKERVVRLAGPGVGSRALDVACGTGDIAFGLVSHGAFVVGLDITHRMVELARLRSLDSRESFARSGQGRRIPHPALRIPAFVSADMCALPFSDSSFDIVTTGYGLRNVPDLDAAIREIHRVLRPGGVLVSLDFNRPSNPVVRAIYLGYLRLVGGALGWVLHRDPDTYRYIPASIERYPGAAGVVVRLNAAGFRRAEWRRVLGGLMAIHVTRK